MCECSHGQRSPRLGAVLANSSLLVIRKLETKE